jgi:hypothetical protein
VYEVNDLDPPGTRPNTVCDDKRRSGDVDEADTRAETAWPSKLGMLSEPVGLLLDFVELIQRRPNVILRNVLNRGASLCKSLRQPDHFH